jgi:hypothetical protein
LVAEFHVWIHRIWMREVCCLGWLKNVVGGRGFVGNVNVVGGNEGLDAVRCETQKLSGEFGEIQTDKR